MGGNVIAVPKEETELLEALNEIVEEVNEAGIYGDWVEEGYALADSLGLSRQVACLAFQFGDGLSNLLWPTCSIVIVCGLGDVRYDRWLKWFSKLFACLVIAQVILLQIAVMTGM